MYGQEMFVVVDQKISAEEAETEVRQAHEVETAEEEDLSKEEESSEEDDHHKEDIEEDKTNRPNRDPYPTVFAILETVFKLWTKLMKTYGLVTVEHQVI